MLRHFTALSHRIDINAPWVHNLRTLQIGMAYDTSEILTVLDATPNLEQLLCAMPTRTEVGDETVTFLLLRALDGYPISELNLTQFREPKESETETRLRKIKGLKVVWKQDVGSKIGCATHTHSNWLQ